MAEAQVSRVAALAEVEDWGGRGLVDQEYEMDVDDVKNCRAAG